MYGEILRSMWDVSERHLELKHLSTRRDKNVIKFANKKKLPSHIVVVRKDLNKLSNARKLDDSESLNKDFFAKRTEYKLLMRKHLKIERETKISELCFASEVDEKMFWKLIKGKRCSSQLGSFMVDGRLTNSPQDIIEMSFNHFKWI